MPILASDGVVGKRRTFRAKSALTIFAESNRWLVGMIKTIHIPFISDLEDFAL
jgi:hypothetical protein